MWEDIQFNDGTRDSMLIFFPRLYSAEVVSHVVEQEKPFCTANNLSKTTKLIFA